MIHLLFVIENYIKNQILFQIQDFVDDSRIAKIWSA